MKKIIPSLFLATLANSSLLIAQSESKQGTGYRVQALSREQGSGNREQVRNTNQVTGCRLQGTGAEMAELLLEDQIGQGTEFTTNYELPTTNRDNLAQDLSYHLMMDPAELKNIEGGIEDLKEVLGSPGKAGLSVSTAAHSPVGNSSSSAAILEARDSDAAATLTVDETGEGDSTKAYLKNEICDNIYMACLAEVATMSLAQRKTAEGMIQEKEEWEAAKDMAMEEEAELKIILERAKGETLAAQKKFDSANAILHGKAYADEAYYNWQVKELAEKLAEARVTTSHATLNAIKFRNTAQRVKSEARLNEAIAMEYKASQALEAATSKTSGVTVQVPLKQIMQLNRTISEEASHLVQSPLPQEGGAERLQQNVETLAIPIATAVEFSPVNLPIVEPLNQLKISEEMTSAFAKKETAAAFETEFSEMIESVN